MKAESEDRILWAVLALALVLAGFIGYKVILPRLRKADVQEGLSAHGARKSLGDRPPAVIPPIRVMDGARKRRVPGKAPPPASAKPPVGADHP